MCSCVRGSQGGESKSDICVYVDGKSAMSKTDTEIGGGQRGHEVVGTEPCQEECACCRAVTQLVPLFK